MITKVSETEVKIVCPECMGEGKKKNQRQTNFYEDEYWEVKCPYCNGKRIVKRRELVKDYEVDDLAIQERKVII